MKAATQIQTREAAASLFLLPRPHGARFLQGPLIQASTEFSPQLFFTEALNDKVDAAPYNARGNRSTRNADDSIFTDQRPPVAARRQAERPLNLHRCGVCEARQHAVYSGCDLVQPPVAVLRHDGRELVI